MVACGGSSAPEKPKAKSTPKDRIVAPRYAAIVGGSGRNLAYDQPADSIHPKLIEHSKKMAQHIYKSATNVYTAVGYGLANMILIEGTDGVVILDPLESVDNAREVMTEFRKITDKPVRAVIYSHNHYDHVMGVQGVVTAEEVLSGAVPIYAHARMMDGLLHQLSVVGEAVGIRSYYTFGSFLEKGPLGSVNEGIGPTLVRGPPGFLPPTKTFDDRLDLDIAGLHLKLMYAPSETDDEIVVWIADSRTLLTAEVIQGETFPNLYTIRGTTYRDPVKWYKTIDRLRTLKPEHMVPSHGRPVEGATEIESLLASYRDAIQFAHDQTVRLINHGLTPDEIATALPHLPPHLAAHPWVGEFYGTVKHSVRNFYTGYLGWFEGDPTFLDPYPRPERSRRYVEMMGGRDTVLKAARTAIENKDWQWGAEILTHVLRASPDDAEARGLKAQALRELGFQQANINWRNFYLTSALELEGKLDPALFDRRKGMAIFSNLPIVHLLENIVCRIDPEKSRDVRLTLGLNFTDTNKKYALEIRRGVVQLHEEFPAKLDVTLTTTEHVFRGVLLRESSFVKEYALRRISVDGALRDVSRFFDYFDPPSEAVPAVAGR